MLPILPVSIGIFLNDISPFGLQVWMQKRQENGPLNGLWEFPGGKVDPGETPEEALKREIWEEVQLDISSCHKIKLFKLFPYDYLDRSICLYVFLVHHSEVPLDKGQWFEISYERKSLPFTGSIPAANHRIIDDLALYFQQNHSEQFIESLWKI